MYEFLERLQHLFKKTALQIIGDIQSDKTGVFSFADSPI
jgi:hypothetical protein